MDQKLYFFFHNLTFANFAFFVCSFTDEHFLLEFVSQNLSPTISWDGFHKMYFTLVCFVA